mgnify:CR=1 FL=1
MPIVRLTMFRRRSTAPLLHDRREDDVAEVRVGVVALEVERPLHELVARDRAARAAEDRLVVDDVHAVEDDRHVALVERDVDVLPLVRRLLGRDARRDAPVEGRHVVAVDGLAVAVKHLDLVDAAQVDARVAARQHPHVVGELEVEEVGALRLQVRAVAVGLAVRLALDAVLKDAVVVGCGSYDEIWSAENYRKTVEDEDQEAIKLALEEVGL